MAIEEAENEISVPPQSQLSLSFQRQKLSGLTVLLKSGHTLEKDGQGNTACIHWMEICRSFSITFERNEE